MTLDEAQELLNSNNISFELREFENEKEYRQHAMLFPYAVNTRPCKVAAISIQSRNEHKNIELQFNLIDGTFIFEELQFGDYCYEMFDCDPATLSDDLIHNISEIMQGKSTYIVVNDLKKKRWLGDACFDPKDNEAAFKKTMERIQKPKFFWSKLLGTKKQYEIFNWDTYQCIVK